MTDPGFKAVAKLFMNLNIFEQHLLVSCPKNMKKLVNELVGRHPFPITVDRTLSREEQIMLGKYDWVKDSVNEEKFPVGKSNIEKTQVVCRLIGYDKIITGERALELIEEDKTVRPATFSELLAFGAQYIEMQRYYSIIAFGSLWQDSDGLLFAPCISEILSERNLNMDPLLFDEDRRFLVVEI